MRRKSASRRCRLMELWSCPWAEESPCKENSTRNKSAVRCCVNNTCVVILCKQSSVSWIIFLFFSVAALWFSNKVKQQFILIDRCVTFLEELSSGSSCWGVVIIVIASWWAGGFWLKRHLVRSSHPQGAIWWTSFLASLTVVAAGPLSLSACLSVLNYEY